eukprot:TRINITY_DN6589_c0_g1_i1.p1 TRINITY_DN6589_c0_g1~~TRINITY_DN6589_c0_g1_i1.p1  ORF type:complete len:1211 (-),score=194.06 TRINITY_DN6589_c0_g1_i1:148-3780(-)
MCIRDRYQRRVHGRGREVEYYLEKINSINQQIKEEQFIDNYQIIRSIASNDIKHRSLQINPLEVIISLQCYIEITCSKQSSSIEGQHLELQLDNFLANSSQWIFLIIGQAGSGKSTFLIQQNVRFKGLMGKAPVHLSQGIELKHSQICELIKLNEYSTKKKKDKLKSKIQQIIQQYQDKEVQVILLLDGYDEFGQDKQRILDCIGIQNNTALQSKFKVVISCRSSELSQISEVFKHNKPAVFYICPINQLQLKNYLQKFIDYIQNFGKSNVFQKFKCLSSAEEYIQIINSNPTLKELATTPIMIRIITSIIPELQEQVNDKAFENITQYDIIQTYTKTWIENQIDKINYNKQNNNINFTQKQIQKWTLQLIESLWINNKGSNNLIEKLDLEKFIEINQNNKSQNKVDEIFQARPELILQYLPLLKVEQDSYSFYHKSILDFYLALLWSQDFKSEELINQEHLNNQQEAIIEEPKSHSTKFLKDLHINQGQISKDVYQSLIMLKDYLLQQSDLYLESQKINQYDQAVNICLQVLNCSKREDFKDLYSSSNAFTLLNSLNYSFSNLDLSYIKVKNSNLENGMFNRTNFRFAQLINCQFTKCILNSADFTGADLTDVNFGIPQEYFSNSNSIIAVAVTSDCNYIVSGDSDSNVKIWNFDTGSLIATLKGHKGEVCAISISPSNKYIISGSSDSTIKVWNLEQGTNLSTLSGHKNIVSSVAISQDEKYIVSGSWDTTIIIWNFENGQPVKTLAQHQKQVTSIAITQNSNFIISGSYDNSLIIWHCATGALVKKAIEHKKPVTSVAVSKDQEYIVSGGKDKLVIVWSFEKLDPLIKLECLTNWVTSVGISQDNKFTIAGSQDKTIKIWKLDSGSQIAELVGHSNSLNSIALTMNDQYIVSGASDNTIKVWNFDDDKKEDQQNEFKKSEIVMTETPDGKYLIIVENDNVIKIYDAYNNEILEELKGHDDHINSIAVSSDSQIIVSGSSDYTIKIWKLQAGEQIRTLRGHSNSVNSVAISEDGTYIVSGSSDKTIKIWEMKTGQLIRTLIGHTKPITSVVINAKKKLITSGSLDGTIKIWNFELSPQVLAQIEESKQPEDAIFHQQEEINKKNDLFQQNDIQKRKIKDEPKVYYLYNQEQEVQTILKRNQDVYLIRSIQQYPFQLECNEIRLDRCIGLHQALLQELQKLSGSNIEPDPKLFEIYSKQPLQNEIMRQK